MRILFLFFLLIPVVEIILLIEVGGYIGALNTAFLVVLTAIIGSMMLKRQGFSTLHRAREKLNYGQIPLQEMMEGICLAVGGALLITPGFVTDIAGFALLLPYTRQWLARSLSKHLQNSATFVASNKFTQRSKSSIIEGEFERDNNDHKPLE